MIKTNYHTHHELCKHAVGTAEDYVKEAIKLNMNVLGFSDHAPSDVIHDKRVRMSWDDLDVYLDDVIKTKAKYSDKLDIYVGLEIESIDPNPDYYLGLLKKVDYLILGQHYIPSITHENRLSSSFYLRDDKELILYAKSIEKAIKTGYFSLIAHPDLYMCEFPKWNEAAHEAAEIICNASVKYNVPLEFNANGIRRGKFQAKDGLRYHYPVEAFWKLAKAKNCKVILSSDCHKPTYLYDDAMKKAESLLKRLDITPIEVLPFK